MKLQSWLQRLAVCFALFAIPVFGGGCNSPDSVFSAASGIISTGTGVYQVEQSCQFTIQTDAIRQTLSDKGAPLYISLTFSSFELECQWDYLFVFTGTNISAGTILASFTGDLLPTPILTTESTLSLYFYSDYAITFSGFNASYIISTCPFDCSGLGNCESGVCLCESPYTGIGCEINSCPLNCNNSGVCTFGANSEFMCVCTSSFKGDDCSIPVHTPRWLSLPRAPIGAAAAPAIYSPELDQVFFFGGSSFNTSQDQLFSFQFSTNTWFEMPLSPTSPIPFGRSGHAMVVVDGLWIYVFGGTNGVTALDDLWVYNISSQTWTQIVSNSSSVTRPVAVAHASAVFASNIRSIIFYGGLSLNDNDTNQVFAFNVDNQTWQFMPSTNPPSDALLGHSMVYDSVNERVLVYGGQYYNSGAIYYNIEVFSFSVLSGVWVSLPAQSLQSLAGTIFFRYLHDATILGDFMVVYGGSPYRPNSETEYALCYSDTLLVYHLTCDTWLELPIPYTSDQPSLARHSHSIFSRDGLLYLFGGFTGIANSDFYVLSHDRCAWITTAAQCILIQYCTWINGSSYNLGTCQEQSSSSSLLSEPTAGSTLIPPFSPCSICKSLPTVADCNAEASCSWCMVNNTCTTVEMSTGCAVQDPCFQEIPSSSLITPLGEVSSCLACTGDCSYCSTTQSCRTSPLVGCYQSSSTCPDLCAQFVSCGSCANPSSNCQWCESTSTCVTQNGAKRCSDGSAPQSTCPVPCAAMGNSADCLFATGCVWCENLNTCSIGDLYPVVYSYGQCEGYIENVGNAPTKGPGGCSCNGHSSSCDSNGNCLNCGNNTQNGVLGQCELCAGGFTGSAVNGGACFFTLANDKNSNFYDTVEPGQYTFMRTGQVYSAIIIYFTQNSGTTLLFLSTTTKTPDNDNNQYIITQSTDASGLSVLNLNEELFISATPSNDQPASFTISIAEDTSDSNNPLSQGISLLFYLIIFFMCFFGLLFVGIFMLKVRQYYHMRRRHAYRPTFDISIMASMIKLSLRTIETGQPSPQQAVISLDKVPNSAFAVVTVLVEMPRASQSEPLGLNNMCLGCAVVIDEAELIKHPDTTAENFFVMLDEAHARRIQLNPHPTPLSPRIPPPQAQVA